MKDSLSADLRRAIEEVSGCRQPGPERRSHKHDEYLSFGLKTAEFRRVVSLGVDELRPAHFATLSRLVDHFRSWSHVDHSLALGQRGHRLKGAEREAVLRVKKNAARAGEQGKTRFKGRAGTSGRG